MIGLYLMLDMPDDYWQLARFERRQTRHLYLVRALNPSTGEPNKFGCYVVDLRLLMLKPGDEGAPAKIFDDYAGVRAFLNWVDEPEREKVVKLVKP
jgi:hypothetical protein